MHLNRSSSLLIAVWCLAGVAGCGNEGESMGNGPGNADGIGGRADPPEATTNEVPNNSSTTDPNGAMTTPDRSTETTEGTGATPSDSTPPNPTQ